MTTPWSLKSRRAHVALGSVARAAAYPSGRTVPGAPRRLTPGTDLRRERQHEVARPRAAFVVAVEVQIRRRVRRTGGRGLRTRSNGKPHGEVIVAGDGLETAACVERRGKRRRKRDVFGLGDFRNL